MAGASKPDPSEQLRTQYLQLCGQLEESIINMRNHAMKPGSAWLAKAELANINQLLAELDQLLEVIKKADTASA